MIGNYCFRKQHFSLIFSKQLWFIFLLFTPNAATVEEREVKSNIKNKGAWDEDISCPFVNMLMLFPRALWFMKQQQGPSLRKLIMLALILPLKI